MQVAGIRRVGGVVEMIEVAEPRPLAGDEVLLEVKAAGVANWDEIVRTGGWDVGARPPMALGVAAAGTVMTAGPAVRDWAPGDAVMTHPVPLRDQGTWAPRLIAPAELLARKPDRASWEAAAAFPVPALTAEQVLGEALDVHLVSNCWSTGPAGSPAAYWSPSPRCAGPRSSPPQARRASRESARRGRVTSSTTTTGTGLTRWAQLGRKPGSGDMLRQLLSDGDLPGGTWRMIDERTWRTGVMASTPWVIVHARRAVSRLGGRFRIRPRAGGCGCRSCRWRPRWMLAQRCVRSAIGSYATCEQRFGS